MTHQNTLRIARGRPSDLPEVSRLLRETWHDTYDDLLGYETVCKLSRRWHGVKALAPSLADATTLFLVAELNDTLVGHALATPSDDGVVIVNRLYVLPRVQGKGIGWQLLKRIERAFSGTPALRLEVERDNTRAVRFYKGQGFAIVDERSGCLSRDDGIPVLVMEKSL